MPIFVPILVPSNFAPFAQFPHFSAFAANRVSHLEATKNGQRREKLIET
jgi:hypothetical protein